MLCAVIVLLLKTSKHLNKRTDHLNFGQSQNTVTWLDTAANYLLYDNNIDGQKIQSQDLIIKYVPILNNI